LPKKQQGIPALIEFATSWDVAVGVPDIHPDVDMPTYPTFPQAADHTVVAMDVQYSNCGHIPPAGDTEQLYTFGVKRLHAACLMWVLRSPYQETVLSTIRRHPELYPIP